MSDPENPSSPDLLASTKEDWGNYPGSHDLLKLTDDNFFESISDMNPTLVMFYAPCKSYVK